MSFQFCDPMDLSNRPIASLFANFRNAQLIAHTQQYEQFKAIIVSEMLLKIYNCSRESVAFSRLW